MKNNPFTDEPLAEDPDVALIGRAYSAPAADASFIAALEDRLAAAFATRHNGSAEQSDSQEESVGTLDSLLRARRELWAGEPDDAQSRRSVAQARREMLRLAGEPQRGLSLGRKLALAGCAAAALLACVWSVPGYSWGRMVNALQQTQWVLVSESAGADETAVYLSTRENTPPLWSASTVAQAAARPEEETELRVGAKRFADTLRNKPRSSQAIESQLFALLLNGTQQHGGLPDEPVEVSSLRPQSVEQGVELQVTLTQGGERVRARFLVDADSHLPLACEVVTPLTTRPEEITARRLTFRYPEAGPQLLAGGATGFRRWQACMALACVRASLSP